MKRLFRPTLARRILAAALLAFVLCFVVIAAFTFYQVFRSQDGALDVGRKAFVESLSQALAEYKTDEQVRAAAEGVQRMVEAQMQQAQRPSTLRILVWTHDGRQVYASISLPVQRPPELASAVTGFVWEGQNYAVTSVASPRYTVDVLDMMPMGSLYKLVMLDSLSDLLIKMLIAFPLFLLPVWFAIHTGLRPLGALSDSLHK